MELVAMVFLASPVVLAVLFVLIGAASQYFTNRQNRRNDDEYAPVKNVYVVLQTNNYYTDNRSITVQAQDMPLIADRQREIQDGQWKALGTGSTAGGTGYPRSLPRRRQAYRLPG